MRNDDRLYRYIPVSVLPTLVITIIILGSLFFEVEAGYASQNPVLFFMFPLLIFITFLTIETPKTIMMSLGMWFPDLRTKIVAGVTAVLGVGIGWALVNFSQVAPNILPIATYPFAMSSYASVGTQAILSLSSGVSFVLHFFVATGEEFMCLLMGLNISNWLYSKFKPRNAIPIILISLLLGRCVWVIWHIWSYNFGASPMLYISALMLGSAFTICAIMAGMLAKGFLFGKEISNIMVIPILLPIAITCHWSFNWFLGNLMIISDLVLPLIITISP